MKKAYLSLKSLQNTINYFQSLDITNNRKVNKYTSLGLFLFLKYHGISTDREINKLDFTKKEYSLEILKMLCGLFDETEIGKKYTCVFPFALNNFSEDNKDCYYNPGTAFDKLLGRIPDTCDNSLIDGQYLTKIADNGNYRLNNNYLIIVKEYLPEDKKLDINFLAAWIYRFYAFQYDDNEYTKIDNFSDCFTRILRKRFIHDFKISEYEQRELLNTSSNNLITPSNICVTGEQLRDLIGLKGKAEISNDSYHQIDFKPKQIISLDEVNQMSQITDRNITVDKLAYLLNNYKQVILYGCPGTGKTYSAKLLENRYKKVSFIQFHPSTDYESFIGGIKYDYINKSFKPQKGYFLNLCEEAEKDLSNNYLIVIDEINRGNLTKIFGEVIVALDRNYQVELLFEELDCQRNSERINLKIPNNLHILGTMNSSDRSVAFVDYALRRRFTFIKFYPNYEIVRELSDDSSLDIHIDKLFQQINYKLLDVLKDEDLLLGQAYFLPSWAMVNGTINWTNEMLQDVFNYSILPILEEYTYSKQSILESIIGSSLSQGITDVERFIEALKERFPSIKKDG
jgi:5-methylcytosine-specific restriction protein B